MCALQTFDGQFPFFDGQFPSELEQNLQLDRSMCRNVEYILFHIAMAVQSEEKIWGWARRSTWIKNIV